MSNRNSPQEIPNVLLIIADHHRSEALGHLGSESVRTPNLDQLAAQGTVVGRMYCVAPVCVASRIAVTSGRYPMNTGCFSNWHPADCAMPTFLHALRDAGVTNAMVGKFHHHVHEYGADFIGHAPDVHQLGYRIVQETSGKAGVGSNDCECWYAHFLRRKGVLGEYRRWIGRRGMNNGTMRPNEPWPWPGVPTQDEYIADQACAFLDSIPTDRPFFLHLGFVGPHPPFSAPKRLQKAVSDVKVPPPLGGQPRDEAAWRAYAACIAEVDEQVGKVLSRLEGRELRENTLIIYTSDHGDMTGDHGRWGKLLFYEGSAHVPFIAAGPGVPKGRIVNAMAELIDVGKTVCDFMGRESHHFDQGMSLKPVLTGETDTHQADVFSEMGSDKMFFDGRYKLMYGDYLRDTREELEQPPHYGPGYGRPVNVPPDRISLYDLENDPGELHNLADDPAHAPLLAEMKEKLLRRLMQNMQSVPLVRQ